MRQEGLSSFSVLLVGAGSRGSRLADCEHGHEDVSSIEDCPAFLIHHKLTDLVPQKHPTHVDVLRVAVS